MAVVVSASLAKKLVSLKEATLLLGWAEGTKVFCCEAVCYEEVDASQYVLNTVALFPAGLGVVGLYKVKSDDKEAANNEDDDDDDVVFDKIVNELKDFIVNPLLAYVNAPLKIAAGKDKSFSNKALLYNTVTAEFSNCNATVLQQDSQLPSTLNIRVRGKLPVSFEIGNSLDSSNQSVKWAFDTLKEKVSSAACAFRLQNSCLLLWNSNQPLHDNILLDDNARCEDLPSLVDGEKKDASQTKKTKKGSGVQFKGTLNVDVLLQTTGDEAIKQSLSCVPIIRYERRNFKSVNIVLGIDTVATVPFALLVANLPALFAEGICCQLSAMEHCLNKFHKDNGKFYLPRIYHFSLPETGYVVGVAYPEEVDETELESYRKELHRKLLLPLDRPLLRRCMKYSFPYEKFSQDYLNNVHVGLPLSRGGLTATVQGTYTYHHYMQDNINDSGWGCAYRSLQTLVSWFRSQGYTDRPIPTHVEIQQALVDAGDKHPSFVNSRKWIGSLEVSYCLNHLLGVSSKIISVSSGSELSSKARELLYHFETQGTPVMIGGGVLAHTILGVDFNERTGDTKFLVLDPHYTGSENLHEIQSKGWCGWKGPNFWDQNAYYNLCCPQRPTGI